MAVDDMPFGVFVLLALTFTVDTIVDDWYRNHPVTSTEITASELRELWRDLFLQLIVKDAQGVHRDDIQKYYIEQQEFIQTLTNPV